MVETRNPLIEQAHEIARREIDETTAEIAAFERFCSRLAAVTPTDPQTPASTTQTLLQHPGKHAADVTGPCNAQAVVTAAYRETVMAVDHHASVYGTGLEADLRDEFGERAVYALLVDDTLTPLNYRYLRTQTRRAVDERREFVGVLEDEVDSLTRCDAVLRDVEARFYEHATNRAGRRNEPSTGVLHELDTALEDLAATRQRTLRSRRASDLRGVDGRSLNRYLYTHALDVTCPVLDETVTLARRVRRHLEGGSRNDSDQVYDSGTAQ